MNFAELGLEPNILRAVEDAGYKTPTPIQEQAIPHVFAGRDLVGTAQTGTGKTAGFTLPMIQILASGRARAMMPRSLILEPTRELAAQVSENFEVYGKYYKLNMALIIGGVSFADQDQKLRRGVDVLIATPGRLLDHVERGKVLLADIKILVIDEADRMLDMGFIPDIERIIKSLPWQRQTLMFSATMPSEIRRLASTYLSNPKEIAAAAPDAAADTVTQLSVKVPSDDKGKRAALRSLLRSEDVRNALVFCNRKRSVGILHRSLVKHGFNAAALHGDLPQSERMATLDRFKKGEVTVLVASNVAARGLDIAEMSHVFNYDVPIYAEDYVHRIGRTGRAGRPGRAFTLVTPADRKPLAAIERLIGGPIPRADQEKDRAPVEPTPPPPAEAGSPSPVDAAPPDTSPQPDTSPPLDTSPPTETAPPTDAGRQVETGPPSQGSGSGRRGRRRRGGTRDKRQTTREDKPRQQETRTQAMRKKTPENRKDGDSEVGMGDHVPAFMLR